MSSSGAAIAAQPGRGDRHDADTSDYQIILPPLPTGSAVLNTVFLHADVRGRPYRVEDIRDTLDQLVLLPEVLALGAYQMNHVWAVTFKSSEGKRRALAAGDLVVKGKRCLVIDPGNRDVRLKLHWLLFHVPDDEVRVALSPYGKVIEVGTEKWRVQGVMGCGSMTRTAVIRLKPGVSLDDLPHQLKIAGGLALVVAPGRAPLCLRCQRTGHIRRECRVPKCGSSKRFGHDADNCVRTYATATGPGGCEANAELVMDEADAEAANEGAAPVSEASDGMAKSGSVRPASERPLTSTGTQPFNVTATTPKEATSSKDEVTVPPSKTTPTKEAEAQQTNEVHMADASALAIKRPLEQDPVSSKGSSVSTFSEPPAKTVPQRRKPSLKPSPGPAPDPRGLDKPTG